MSNWEGKPRQTDRQSIGPDLSNEDNRVSQNSVSETDRREASQTYPTSPPSTSTATGRDWADIQGRRWCLAPGFAGSKGAQADKESQYDPGRRSARDDREDGGDKKGDVESKAAANNVRRETPENGAH